MDRFSPYYGNERRRENALSRKISLFVAFMIFACSAYAIYSHHLLEGVPHKIYQKIFGEVKEDGKEDDKNKLPPVHFEFYTALSNGNVVEAKPKVAISSHDELEESLFDAINKGKKE